MFRTLLSIVCFFGLSLSLSAEIEFVTLTNPEGAKIEAVFMSMSRDYVTIRVKGRRDPLTTELAMFSKRSQETLMELAAEKALFNDLEFGVSKKRFSAEQEGSDSTTGRDSKEGYSLRVTNDSNFAADGITAKYIIVIKREWMGRKKSSDHRIEHTTGSVVIPEVGAKETIRVDTKGVLLKEEKLNGGWFLTGGGQTSSKDELEGIIVEFYYKDKMIFQESKPNNLLKDFTVAGPLRGASR